MCRINLRFSKGFSVLFWVKLSKVYEKMLLLGVVGEENEGLVEVWFVSKRVFKEFRKVEEMVDVNRSIDEESERNGLGGVAEFDIESAIVVKFLGDDPYKFPIKRSFIGVDRTFHFAFCLSKNTFSIHINNIEVAHAKYTIPNGNPDGILFQAIDKSVSLTNIYEGQLTEPQINELYHLGPTKIPELSSIKPLGRFPQNLRPLLISIPDNFKHQFQPTPSKTLTEPPYKHSIHLSIPLKTYLTTHPLPSTLLSHLPLFPNEILQILFTLTVKNHDFFKEFWTPETMTVLIENLREGQVDSTVVAKGILSLLTDESVEGSTGSRV